MSDLIKPTIRDIKNKIIAAMPTTESRDAIVGTTDDGSYIILTEDRVIEVYQTADGKVWASRKNVSGSWDSHEF